MGELISALGLLNNSWDTNVLSSRKNILLAVVCFSIVFAACEVSVGTVEVVNQNGESPISSLSFGDCFNQPELEGTFQSRESYDRIEIVPCDQPHRFMVMKRVEIDDPEGAPYPGTDWFWELFSETCSDGVQHLSFPHEDPWNEGDRHYLCVWSNDYDPTQELVTEWLRTKNNAEEAVVVDLPALYLESGSTSKIMIDGLFESSHTAVYHDQSGTDITRLIALRYATDEAFDSAASGEQPFYALEQNLLDLYCRPACAHFLHWGAS